MTQSSTGAHGDAVPPPSGPRPATRIVHIVGHGLEVPERHRAHVVDKLDRLQRYDDTIERYDVAVFHERNPRRAKLSDRVEITGTGQGRTVRVHADGSDFHPAFAAALAKLEARLHRAHERRVMRNHSGGHKNPVVDTTA